MSMTLDETRPSLKSGLDLVMLFANAIRDVGQMPEGKLYAQVCGHMDLATFRAAVDMLIRCELVRRDACHVLIWIGPAKEQTL